MKSFLRTSAAWLLLSAMGLRLAPALAAESSLALMPPVVGASELFTSHGRSALALHGYDPLTYHTGTEPRPGSPDHELVWSGLVWRFVSEANRAAFLRDPESFAPRLGGYDAEAAAGGRLVDTDPLIWARRSGRVYLFRNPAARERFQDQRDAFHQAEARWPALRAGLVAR